MKIVHIIIITLIINLTAIAQNNSKPNIILFLVDDMGLMDTSTPFLTDKFGNPKIHELNQWYKTPNMDRLSKLGTRFSTFYAQSVCSPSRISLLTGQNATRHKTTQWINPESNNKGNFGPTNWNWEGLTGTNNALLPKILQKNGYKTIFIGKAHLGPVGKEGSDPLNLGFDVNIGGCAWGSPGSYLGSKNYMRLKNKKPFHAVPHLKKYHNTNTFLTEALTLEAKNEIEKAVQNNKPFFLQLSHYALHAPFTFDTRFKEHYSSNKYSENAQKFATLVEGMDKSLGDIMDKLEETNIAENTLIIFLGDNGSDAPISNIHNIGSSAPLRGKKGTHYEGGMRIPFITSWAKPSPKNEWQQKLPIAQGNIQPQMGNIMDIYPTILELLNIEKPKEYIIDGHSLSKNLKGEHDLEKPTSFLMHFPHSHRSNYFTSYRNANWKLIYHYFPKMNPENVPYELYNLETDPAEQINLAKNNPEKLNELFFLMKKQLLKEGALFPINRKGKELKPVLGI